MTARLRDLYREPVAPATPRGDLSFRVFRDAGGEFRWRGVARNGEVVATGAEGYSRAADAWRALCGFVNALALATVQQGGGEAVLDRTVEVRRFRRAGRS